MKGLSLTEPWASLVVTGEKKIETRSWKTQFRGLIAIQAAKNFPAYAKEVVGVSFFKALEKHGIFSTKDFTLGAIIGVAEIKGCLPTDGSFLKFTAVNSETENGEINNLVELAVNYRKPLAGTAENCFGDYSSNRYMWFLENARRLKTPIPCKGALSLWNVPADVEAQIIAQLAEAASERLKLSCGDDCGHSDAEHQAFDYGVECGERGDANNLYAETNLREAWRNGFSVGQITRKQNA